jgi:uncharacterized membrane protein YagU involved in acid resistance
MTNPTTHDPEKLEMPAPTAWPLVLALGIALLAFGVATNLGFLFVGAPVFLFGMGGWISQLLPGQGEIHEGRVPMEQRPHPIQEAPGTVDALRPGGVGYRFRLPEHVHPISSGVKGGMIGGLLMPLPALLYGLLQHGSLWFPVNLLAGMVIPGISDASLESLRQFSFAGLLLGTIIHAVFSVTFGLMYGVILPMLPQVKGGPLIFGGLVMPLLWTGVCYGLMGIVNPPLQQHVSWPWFLVSQLVYGLAMSYVVNSSEKVAVSQAPLNFPPQEAH